MLGIKCKVRTQLVASAMCTNFMHLSRSTTLKRAIFASTAVALVFQCQSPVSRPIKYFVPNINKINRDHQSQQLITNKCAMKCLSNMSGQWRVQVGGERVTYARRCTQVETTILAKVEWRQNSASKIGASCKASCTWDENLQLHPDKTHCVQRVSVWEQDFGHFILATLSG